MRGGRDQSPPSRAHRQSMAHSTSPPHSIGYETSEGREEARSARPLSLWRSSYSDIGLHEENGDNRAEEALSPSQDAIRNQINQRVRCWRVERQQRHRSKRSLRGATTAKSWSERCEGRSPELMDSSDEVGTEAVRLHRQDRRPKRQPRLRLA